MSASALNLLVIGSGAREHAIVWRLAQDPRVARIFVYPGNAGIEQEPKVHTLVAASDDQLLSQLSLLAVDYAVIGPEVPQAAGLTDVLLAAGVATFGCTQATARLESSKSFAKDFMRSAGIAHAQDRVFHSRSDAVAFVNGAGFAAFGTTGAVVVKFDGLAAGKGVVVCASRAEALDAIDQLWQSHGQRDARGQLSDDFSLVLEECLTGREASILAFCDGKSVRLMPVSRDHKRLLDGDLGPNTGGMGVVAPVADVSAAQLAEIEQTVFVPFLRELQGRQLPYCGVIFVGLMWESTAPNAKPRVLEFNCRFGDPEAQTVLSLLQTPLLDVIAACCEERLADLPIRYADAHAVSVVLASGGYPEQTQTHEPISLPLPAQYPAAKLFHAATRRGTQGEIVTSGGRVLCATATGASFGSAREAAYALAHAVHFNGKQFRKDIGMTLNPTPHTSAYAQSGVNIDEGNKAVELMKSAVKATYTKDVLAGIGAFGGMMSLSAAKGMSNPVLVASTDGVGTKTMIAAALKRWDSVGADLVNHSINDVLVQGASPLFFMDYVASGKLDAHTVATIVGGMAHACKDNGCVLLGGETAEMPGVYHPGHWDIAGTIVGLVDRAQVLDGSAIRSGDVLLGLPSTGLHTNGYSLARKALEGLDWTAPVGQLVDQGHFNGLKWLEHFKADAEKSLGDLLLAVHRPYLREYQQLKAAGVSVSGLCHITGGGFVENIPRVLPADLSVTLNTQSIQTPLIFELIALRGQVARDECYRVFNMGVGMVVFVRAADAQDAQNALGQGVMVLGTVGPFDAQDTEQVVLV